MARKKGDRARLTPTDREWIYQTYMRLQYKSQTAKRCGFSIATVGNVIKELTTRGEDAAQLPTSREARAEVAAKLASKFHVKVDEFMQSITKEDLESGRIPIKDKEGNLIKYFHYGPSLLQKATAIGIITDKANVAQQFEQKMLQDVQDGHLLLPSDIAGMISAVKGTMKSISGFNIQFEEDNPDIITNAQEIIAEVEMVEAQRPDVESFDEFDNP